MMQRFASLVVVALACAGGVMAFTNPMVPSIMPLPQLFLNGSTTATISPLTMAVQIDAACCIDDIKAAVQRSMANAVAGVDSTTLPHLYIRLAPWRNVSTPLWSPPSANFQMLTIYVTQQAPQSLEDQLSDESYTLDLQQTSGTLTANTLVGAYRALESFSQLIQWDGTQFVVPHLPIHIEDAPRFAFRSLLVDTARHYMPPSTLTQILDGMAAVKMNVMHWHIVDSQSFPLESKVYPLLSGQGALHPKLVYTHEDVKTLVAHAASLGIRIIPEFDVPGHTASWGFGYPDLLVHCNEFVGGFSHMLERAINYMAMDPISEYVFTFLDNFFREIAALFPDSTIHLGGDEVQPGCWLSDPAIKAYMQANQFNTTGQVQAAFTSRLLSIAGKYWSNVILWEDAFAGGSRDPRMTVAVWNNQTLLETAAQAGFKTIQAWGAYLDRQNPTGAPGHWMWFDTWDDMYTLQVPQGLSSTVLSKLQGVEATAFAENVDAANVMDRIFSRLGPIAERMWSADSVRDVPSARSRMADFRCKLRRRGFAVGPPEPDYCDVAIPAPNSASDTSMPAGAVAALVVLSAFVVALSVGLLVLYRHLRYHENNAYLPIR